MIIAIVLSGAFALLSTPQIRAAGAPIRINAGGGTLSVNGTSWDRCYGVSDCFSRASNGYMTWPSDPPAISGVVAPASQSLYQSYWSAVEPCFTFAINVANGPHMVRLHFAEQNKTAAYQRVFDVRLEGATVLDNFDIFLAAGGRNAAVVRQFPVTVSDGAVTLDFVRLTDEPQVSGIEVIPLDTLPTSTPTPSPLPGGATNLFTWNSGATAPMARFEAVGGVVGQKLYVIGGFINEIAQTGKSVDVYDLPSNTWQRIADIPEAISHAPVVVDGTTLYVLGGFVGDNPGPSSNRVWKLNTLTNTWSAGPAMPGGRGGAGAARVGRNIHFFGGATRTAGVFDDADQADHYVLNIDTGVWTTAANLPNPRNHMVAVALNGKIYAMGGQHGDYEATTSQSQVDVYDPNTNTWSRAADLPEGKSHAPGSTFVVDGRIMMIGGAVNGGSNGWASDEVLLYDPATNVWLELPPIPAYRKTPIAGVIGDRIVVATGGGYGPTDTTWIAKLPASWEPGPGMPVALGEVAGGIIGRMLYLVGEGSAGTVGYDLSSNAWSGATLAQRAYAGNHHAAEVVNGKLYLFGGLGSGQGKVQIYNPATNQWSLGADMPFAAGSSASALIGGQVYVAGGIVGSATTNRMARYNPATNTWAELATMPQGRNHAAAATDGSKLYVFGGRGAGSGDDNSVANGFNTLQVYDPATNTWKSSLDSGSTLAPVPQARGGAGRAVYLNGEFYVIGGETVDGAGATASDVYQRVDIYNPTTNVWRFGTSMPTARHGVFPLAIGGRVYVAGGGTQAGSSQSALLEVYNPGPAPTTVAQPTPTTQVGSTYTLHVPAILK
ncbi:MAG TPA: kelch repeat-containing protein [Herpetosiphonaceae bacterium]|nr:kelch repeat-containing protein [Herpetosiphonaceae bacterium]